MPYRRLPNSVSSVIRTLKTARDAWKNTAIPAERAITAEHFAQLDDADPNSLLNRLIKEASDVDLAQAGQAPLSTALSQLAARLTVLVSHFHQVFDLAVTRGVFQSGARRFYGREISSTSIPNLSSYDALEEAAEKVCNGELARQAAEGAEFKPMSLPSAQEVDLVRQEFHAVRCETQKAQANTNREREELDAIYKEAYDLAVDICDHIEFFYRKDANPSSRRAKCIRWGVVYVYGAQETPDAPVENPPAPEPPAGT
jgi:hypothetical protein